MTSIPPRILNPQWHTRWQAHPGGLLQRLSRRNSSRISNSPTMVSKLTVIPMKYSMLIIIPVWSLGCVLFELLTLYPPYYNFESPQMFAGVGMRPPLDLHTTPGPDVGIDRIIVPQELQQDPLWKQLVIVYESCTNSLPEDRPSIEEVKEMIQKIKNGETIVPFKRPVANRYC